MRLDPTERIRRAADDWSQADPEIRDAVERGLMRDMGVPRKHDTPYVAPGKFWPAVIVCVCIVGVVVLAILGR